MKILELIEEVLKRNKDFNDNTEYLDKIYPDLSIREMLKILKNTRHIKSGNFFRFIYDIDSGMIYYAHAYNFIHGQMVWKLRRKGIKLGDVVNGYIDPINKVYNIIANIPGRSTVYSDSILKKLERKIKAKFPGYKMDSSFYN